MHQFEKPRLKPATEDKYRAWCPQLNVMIYDEDEDNASSGMYGYMVNSAGVWIYDMSGESFYWMQREEHEDVILMRCTGKQDKNGRDIYAGDILSSFYHRDASGKDIRTHIYTVEYQTIVSITGYDLPFLENAEVIGNIHQNQKLFNA